MSTKEKILDSKLGYKEIKHDEESVFYIKYKGNIKRIFVKHAKKIICLLNYVRRWKLMQQKY